MKLYVLAHAGDQHDDCRVGARKMHRLAVRADTLVAAIGDLACMAAARAEAMCSVPRNQRGGLREAATMDREQTVLINMSGRGDKDIFTIADALDDAKWKEFLRQKVDKL